MGLRIQIDKERSKSKLGPGNCQVNSSRGFTAASLLVCDSDCPHDNPLPLRTRLLLNINAVALKPLYYPVSALSGKLIHA